VLKEMVRDKRTLALMFVAPLFILTLIYFLFQSNATPDVKLGVQNVDSSLVQALDQKHLELKTVHGNQAAKTVIRDHDYAGVLREESGHLTLTLANASQSDSAVIIQSLKAAQLKLASQATQTVIKTQQQALRQLVTELKRLVPTLTVPSAKAPAKPATVTTHYLYGSADSTFFDTLLPIMMGFVVFFFVFLISGISLLRERTTGTLFRLLATPIKRSEILLGYLSGYGVFALVQTLIVVTFSVLAFKIQILGNVSVVLLINLLLAIVALSLGLLISTFAASEFQMMQFIPLLIIPQIFFSGIIPVAQMPNWLQALAHVMPLYYGADAMSQVITKGVSLAQVSGQLSVLVGFAVLFFALNLLTMRRYRQV